MKRRRRSQPSGFTLIELMIVIAIILLLIALTLPIVGNITNQARRAATKTTIKKAHELLQARIEAFEREFPTRFQRATADRRKYNSFSPTDIIIRKTAFREMFPSVLNGQAINTLGSMGTLPDTSGTTPTAADNAEALLYMITKMQTYGGSGTGAETTFVSGEIKDTDGDGQMELVDGWGRPIRFYRWPTRLIQRYTEAKLLIKGLPTNAADRMKDGDDPSGALSASQSQTFHDHSWMHPPLIVSAGVDGRLGLYEPSDNANSGHLAAVIVADIQALDDNITNLNNQAGDD